MVHDDGLFGSIMLGVLCLFEPAEWTVRHDPGQVFCALVLLATKKLECGTSIGWKVKNKPCNVLTSVQDFGIASMAKGRRGSAFHSRRLRLYTKA